MFERLKGDMKHRILFCVCVFAWAHGGFAQHAKVHPEYKELRFRGMPYGLFTPASLQSGQKYPMITYLHGSRDTVSHDAQWYQSSFQKEHTTFVLTPKCLNSDQGWGNTWTDKHSDATAKTLELIDSLTAVLQVDRSRLYLYGISMGSFGVFSVVQKNPGKFAAAVAICGGSDTKAAKSLLNTPLWIFHGSADNVVPVHLSRDVYNEMLRQGGKKVRYTEYPGVKHNSWEKALREPQLTEWLFDKRL
jgi:predicted peptidase